MIPYERSRIRQCAAERDSGTKHQLEFFAEVRAEGLAPHRGEFRSSPACDTSQVHHPARSAADRNTTDGQLVSARSPWDDVSRSQA